MPHCHFFCRKRKSYQSWFKCIVFCTVQGIYEHFKGIRHSYPYLYNEVNGNRGRRAPLPSLTHCGRRWRHCRGWGTELCSAAITLPGGRQPAIPSSPAPTPGRLGKALMGNKTRGRALEKVDRLGIKVGYPDHWEDFSTMAIAPEAPLLTNVLAACRFNAQRERQRLWQPVARSLSYAPLPFPSTDNTCFLL